MYICLPNSNSEQLHYIKEPIMSFLSVISEATLSVWQDSCGCVLTKCGPWTFAECWSQEKKQQYGTAIAFSSALIGFYDKALFLFAGFFWNSPTNFSCSQFPPLSLLGNSAMTTNHREQRLTDVSHETYDAHARLEKHTWRKALSATSAWVSSYCW